MNECLYCVIGFGTSSSSSSSSYIPSNSFTSSSFSATTSSSSSSGMPITVNPTVVNALQVSYIHSIFLLSNRIYVQHRIICLYLFYIPIIIKYLRTEHYSRHRIECLYSNNLWVSILVD